MNPERKPTHATAPYVEFDRPPTSLNELMKFDRGVFAEHPWMTEFLRPITRWDALPRDGGVNAVRVLAIEPGIRYRTATRMTIVRAPTRPAEN
jgi:hypothetical protein